MCSPQISLGGLFALGLNASVVAPASQSRNFTGRSRTIHSAPELRSCVHGIQAFSSSQAIGRRMCMSPATICFRAITLIDGQQSFFHFSRKANRPFVLPSVAWSIAKEQDRWNCTRVVKANRKPRHHPFWLERRERVIIE